MPLLPYCMIEGQVEISAPERGVQQAMVESMSQSGLRVYYSRLDSLSSDAGSIQQSALAFHKVVSSIFEQAAVLPFRFPTLLADAEELQSHLEGNAQQYLEGLRRLRGKAQMEVRISLAGPEASGKSGTDYLRERQKRQAALRQAAGEIRSQTQPLLADWEEREAGSGWRCYALIAKAATSQFREMVVSLGAAPGVQIGVSGPWPATEFLKMQAK